MAWVLLEERSHEAPSGYKCWDRTVALGDGYPRYHIRVSTYPTHEPEPTLSVLIQEHNIERPKATRTFPAGLFSHIKALLEAAGLE